MKHSVLLDTSFFIRLLNDEDPLHENVKGYFRYFLEKDILLKVSTISIAEYCVKGELNDLPLKNIQILPFNLDHAKRTGEFANVVFEERNISDEKGLKPRAVIPNDSKLFAQADIDKTITHFVTSDTSSMSVHRVLCKRIQPNFEIIDVNIPYHQKFGILDFK